jgi:two-component system NtrC family response regulator
VGAARLIDRQRLAVLLQAAGLLSVLERAGWGIPDWSAAQIAPDGRLAVERAEPGRTRQAQEILTELLDRLFGVVPGSGRAVRGLAGKGGARSAARTLRESWRQSLVPLAADDAVGQILDAAPFLWEPAYAAARTALAGEMRRSEDGGAERAVLWVAGPSTFRRRLLGVPSGAAGLAALRELLAGAAARELWEGLEEGDPRELTAARRWRAAVAAWARHPPRSEEDRIAFARALAALGRFETALAALAGLKPAAARILRAECQAQMGQLGPAWATLAALRKARMAPDDAVELAEIASRVLANRGARRAGEWLRLTLAAAAKGSPRTALRGRLVAALAAWDRGQRSVMAAALEEARPDALGSGDPNAPNAPGDPDLAWRWHHARSLLALGDGDGAAATEHAARALRLGRRRLPRHRAAGLWNELGLCRALAGDLAGAERAFRHSHRLFLGCDGPRKTTLALANLAEIRLRRGRLAGVREILERSTAENRLAGNVRGLTQDLELQARWELAAGRPEAALAHCNSALAELARHEADWRRDELRLFAARALGWLGRTDEAAATLEGVLPAVLLELEPEERPAVLALAGRRAEARRTAGALADPGLRALWGALLSGDGLSGGAGPALLWSGALAALEPYRAGRLVYDAERVAPGAAPPDVLRTAAAALRSAGADALAAPLEIRGQAREETPVEPESPWHALADYCSRAPGDPEALAALFAGAGYPDPPAADPADRAGRPDPVLRALQALAARDRAAVSSRPSFQDVERPARLRSSTGMVGESPGLREALERLDRLAARDLPILVLGESGTGKELAARRVHRASSRARAPFLAVNCAALSETLILSDLFGHARGAFTGADRERSGVFQAAEGGTVFLDEIGDLPLSAQAMLLRVLQEGEVRRLGESEPRRIDVRVLAATHRDLDAMVQAKTFRQDLYFRLKVGIIELPPLRERGHDVLLLAESFLARPGGARLSNEARASLLAYSWPGNVRELENVLRVAAALAGHDPIRPEHLELPGVERPSATFYHREVDALRRRLIESALAECGGNLTAAAQRLGMSRQGFSYLRRQLGID